MRWPTFESLNVDDVHTLLLRQMVHVRNVTDSQQNRAPMRAADLEKHPEFETVVWDLKPARSGTVAVAKDRWGPINIAYEIHGVGPTKLVVCHRVPAKSTQSYTE